MIRKSFVTSMPDKSGAFLRASKIIANYGGNIVRVSYNKAVDLHMLFLDIVAEEDKLREIEKELLGIGYLNDRITEIRVIEVSIRIPDRPGAVLPALEILNKHEINISYINSCSGDEPYQDFKMGLLIENPLIIKTLLDEISEVYQINIIQCDSNEENLDNTVFYIRLANEMQKLLDLNTEKTMQFITESNRILQTLQAEGEDAGKVFEYIRRFAYFVSSNRGDNFKVNIEKLQVGKGLALYSIQPLCGSNTYVFDAPGELIIIDTGYAIYADEMQKLFDCLWPDFEAWPKKLYITHADVDHCGLLSEIENAEIILNKKSADSLQRQASGLPDYRENTELRFGYSRISQIISGYMPPDPGRFTILDAGTPEEHDDLMKIGEMPVGGLVFDIYEGSGGHLGGEMVYVCEKRGIIFTGDLLVNISGFSRETAEFNSLAPYLMKSVNIDSGKAKKMRDRVMKIAANISAANKRECIICCGHGPVSKLIGGKLEAYGPGD
jgi:glyoxylase-like metal-dependent hydrolase (beta-lactamase superfamily II)/ACT domain-containing protein